MTLGSICDMKATAATLTKIDWPCSCVKCHHCHPWLCARHFKASGAGMMQNSKVPSGEQESNSRYPSVTWPMWRLQSSHCSYHVMFLLCYFPDKLTFHSTAMRGKQVLVGLPHKWGNYGLEKADNLPKIKNIKSARAGS